MRALFGMLAIACSLCAQTSLDQAQLEKIRETAIATLFAQPNYTCLETVDRNHEVNGTPEVEDTLRLEVAIVSGKEMFGWPGAENFSDADVMTVIRGGLFDTGNFGIYPRMLFFGDAAHFSYQGDSQVNNRKAIRYDFVVPKEASGFHIQRKDLDVAVGFHGSIYADAVSFELMRLTAIAEALPEPLGLSSATDTVDYGRAKLGEGNFLLPLSSESVTTGPKTLDRSHVAFSKCARFAGESRLIFEDETSETGNSAAHKVVTLPAGTEVPLAVHDINLTNSAVGDSVEATVTNDIKRGKEILIPKGATAVGRIIKLSRYAKEYRLSLRFQGLEWAGGSARMNAELKSIKSGKAELASKDVVVPREANPTLTGLSMTWKIVP